MKESLRLSVPVPCMEDWGRMTPVERGRHCGQCCKTVVDFTGMSDGEVVEYFKRLAAGGSGGLGSGVGGSGVCGRFAADQLGRELAPMPVQRNGWKGWQLVVAGALVFGNGPEPGPGRWFGTKMLGKPAVVDTRMGMDSTVLMADTSKPVVVAEIAGPRVLFELPADTVTSNTVVKPEDLAFSGLVVILPDTIIKMDTMSRVRAAVGSVVDTVVDRVVDTVVDRVVDLVRDTVGVIGSGGTWGSRGPVEVVTVYPNPVGKGGVVNLSWNGSAGRYLVSVLSVGGSLIQEKVVDVMQKGQVDTWAVPDGLAAGVYFIRVARPGEAGYTAKLVIQ